MTERPRSTGNRLDPNPDFREVNVAAERADEGSVVYGDFTMLLCRLESPAHPAWPVRLSHWEARVNRRQLAVG